MRILVVEDEPRMAALLAQTLREEGHLVVATSDGRDGLEIARSATFDVIVLDVMLPSMDGTTIARKLREGRNQTPLLMLTGRDALRRCRRGRARFRCGRLSGQTLRDRRISRANSIGQPPRSHPTTRDPENR